MAGSPTYLVISADLSDQLLQEKLNQLAHGGYDVICCIPGDANYLPRLVLRSWTSGEPFPLLDAKQQINPPDLRWLQPK